MQAQFLKPSEQLLEGFGPGKKIKKGLTKKYLIVYLYYQKRGEKTWKIDIGMMILVGGDITLETEHFIIVRFDSDPWCLHQIAKED